MSSINKSIFGYQQKLAISRLGLWLFFASDAFMFGGLLVSRFYLLGYKSFNLDQNLGLLVTSILLISSFFMNRAEVMVSQGNQKGFITSLVITILLGISFLVGVVGLEWGSAHFGPGDGAEGAVFYMMTGMHAFHVLTGIIFLSFVLRNGINKKYTPEKHYAVEASANYWHFIDVVWIIFYPVLYLMGTV
ncbi:MAG: cytochrome c oxidase subunit 3 [Anaerolineaceae bacterium]|jgi:cytochrome c oxidase subunit 3|nr:cytochrome c oxidase subunit 3 [Anaerolineaceae bacterium]